MIDMIRKLLNALNSSEYSWQLSLAIALGMIVGLTPFSSPHNALFYLLAFVININLGLFFVSVAVFAAIGYLLDPMMESLGYYLLTLPSLESLWTTIYNDPLLALLNLNNSLVLGSLVFGLLLFLPLFFVLQQIVKVYRGPISRITGKIPVVKYVLSFDQKKAEANKNKKPSKVRIWGFALLIILTLPITIFALFFMDTIIKNELEKALSEPVGRQATVASVQTSLFPLSMVIEKIVVPDSEDEMKNSFEVARVAFDLDLARALHKKVIINEMSVTGVVLEGERKTPSKKLAPKPAPKADEEVGFATKVALEVKDQLPDPATLVKNEKLKSDTEGKQIEARLNEIKTYWENQQSKFDSKRFKELESEYKALENRAKNIKKADEIQPIIKDAKALEEKLKNLQKEYKELITQFNKDNRESKELLSRLKELPNEDFKALKDKYSLDMDGAFNVAEALLGGDVMDNVKKAKKYYEEYSPYFEMFKDARSTIKGEPLPKPERGKGRIVKFVEYHPTPKWHLKKLDLDVTTANGDQLIGRLTNATSSQKTTKKPMEFVATSIRSKQYRSLEFVWTHDRLSKYADLMTLELLGADKSKISANRLYMNPSKVDTKLDLIVKDGAMLGVGKLTFFDTKLGVESPKSELERMVDRTMSGVTSFVVDVGLKGKPLSPKISLKTDLDNQLKKRFSQEIERAKKEFEAKLKEELNRHAKEYLANAGATAKDIEAIERLINKEASAADLLGEKIGTNLSEDALKDELKKRLTKELDTPKEELNKKAKDLFKKLK